MIHAVCDFCGKDADRTANLLSITSFQNFARYHSDSSPYGSSYKSSNFVICSDCLKKHDLPNPYHKYYSITDQRMNYEKNLDNYTEDDLLADRRRDKEIKGY